MNVYSQYFTRQDMNFWNFKNTIINDSNRAQRKTMIPVANEEFELSVERLLDAPRRNVWRCWSEPKLLEKWFAPPSWMTEVKSLEQSPGGASHIIMRGPNGEISDGAGVFLEAIPEQRLVFTNAYTSGWKPAITSLVVPYMTIFIEMSDEGEKTRYVVRALHWSEEDRKQHKEKGFYEGWLQTSNQLETLARTLN